MIYPLKDGKVEICLSHWTSWRSPKWPSAGPSRCPAIPANINSVAGPAMASTHPLLWMAEIVHRGTCGIPTTIADLTRHHECNLEDNIMQSERNPENQKEVLGTTKNIRHWTKEQMVCKTVFQLDHVTLEVSGFWRVGVNPLQTNSHSGSFPSQRRGMMINHETVIIYGRRGCSHQNSNHGH